MELPDNYPYGCSDEVISASLKACADEIAASNAQTNKVLQLAPLIIVGHSELQNRQTKRITRLSIGLGVLSLIIAGVALWISVAGNSSNTRWQTTNLELLRGLNEQFESCARIQAQQVDVLKSIDQKTQTQNSKTTGDARNPKSSR
jgi:hypothetical protein